jgi:hypothetical protein
MLVAAGLALWAYLVWQRVNLMMTVRGTSLLEQGFKSGFIVAGVIELLIISVILLALIGAV